MCITFDEVDGFIGFYDGNIYLVLLWSEKYDSIYSKIRYLISIYLIYIYIYIYIYISFKISYRYLKNCY